MLSFTIDRFPFKCTIHDIRTKRICLSSKKTNNVSIAIANSDIAIAIVLILQF